MKVISVVEDENVIKKILKHLGLWDQQARPPPKANSPPIAPQYHIDYTVSNGVLQFVSREGVRSEATKILTLNPKFSVSKYVKRFLVKNRVLTK